MADRPLFGGAVTTYWAIVLLLALVEPAQAADGDLDPGFGGDGIVTLDVLGQRNRFDAVAIQPADSKIVVAGSVGFGATRDFAVARFNPDGSLDTGFGSGGIAILDVSGTNEIDGARAMALQADGKIVLSGESGASGTEQFAVVRFTVNGSPDPDFDGDGRVLTPFPGGRSMAVKCAIQPGDGKIVVAREFRAGTSGADGDVAAARYNPDGSLARASTATAWSRAAPSRAGRSVPGTWRSSQTARSWRSASARRSLMTLRTRKNPWMTPWSCVTTPMGAWTADSTATASSSPTSAPTVTTKPRP